MENRINNPQDARAYLMAGNATFTIVSNQTQERYTFKVNAPRDVDPRNDTTRWVSMLCDGDNYVYVGMIKEGDLRLTRKSRMTRESRPYRAFRWLLHRGLVDQFSRLEFWHSGRCGRCNRELTVPESISRGLGPTCASLHE